MKKLLLFCFIFLAGVGLYANDDGVFEPRNKDDALIIVSIRFSRFLNLDSGPNAVRLCSIAPWISGSYMMGKDGELFYMGNLKLGRTYRIANFVVEDASLFTATTTVTTYTTGYQGDDKLSLTVDKPGIYYMGDFVYTEGKGLEYEGATRELALLKKLSGNLFFRPSWKKFVDDRIKELSK